MYKLDFLVSASKEWKNLDRGLKDQFLKVLDRRLLEPRVEGALLSGDLEGLYRIKLAKSGYRLVYAVQDEILTVLVIAVGKRENKDVYRTATKRLRQIGGT
jgi:mRNA interferase RelE/StbE